MLNKILEKENIFKMVFFNVKTVTQYPTLSEYKKNDKKKYELWMSKQEDTECSDEHYLSTACFSPECSKIVSATICNVYEENGELKRNMIMINDSEEKLILNKLTQYFNQMDLGQEMPIICGHNVMGYDIPVYLKRAMAIYDGFKIPSILKHYLSAKPWETNVVDTNQVWKFNGTYSTSLMDISNHLGLKMNFDIEQIPDLCKHYWSNIEKSEKDTLKFCSLQSANQVNLTIQMVNMLRQM